ncbi:7739_t:CDS:2 [Funneliformis geosporum]|uniref:7739_t:CDS:1 n=1 Tax=Funneliformis geosporum TaxID=1117311 RepID=A0A9W4X2Z8_9GLOM|nr:7739_t:CDS:2 [Funneliformis geosporum]
MLIDNKIKDLELERKRKAMEKHKKDVIETCFHTFNSAIPNSECNNVYFVDPMKDSVPFLDIIWRSKFVALYGARISEKSTCVIQVKKQLIDEGFICIYEFARFFSKDKCKKRVVLFVDEYDVLYETGDDIRASLLRVICGIKNAKDKYSLWSSVAVSPFSILHLNSNRSISPFNVKDPKIQISRRSNSLQKSVLDYATFRKMVYILTKDKARKAMQLIQPTFIEFFDLVQIVDKRNLAEVLTAEGVLIRDEETKDRFKMSFVLVDKLV